MLNEHNKNKALRYFMWVVENQGDPTGVSHGDEILALWYLP